MNRTYHPLRSLQEGHWFKLICGASFQHLPAIRNLALACTLAGVDCIDVAADPAVILAAWEGIQAARPFLKKAQQEGIGGHGSPWLMVSLNDGEDPHFRKAQVEPVACPADCPRPCETVCPTQAIAISAYSDGIAVERCYGCGRCIPICPYDRISARSYVTPAVAIAPLVLEGVDALEIHTQPGRLPEFCRLWQAITPWLSQLKLVAISCPDGDGVVDYLRSLLAVMDPLPCPLIWQTDGRPMSGDIGDGTTHAAIRLGQKVLAAQLPGYVQLAGGTNGYTVAKLRELGLLAAKKSGVSTAVMGAHSSILQGYASPPTSSTHASTTHISGIAYGSYLRSLLSPVLDQLDQLDQLEWMNIKQMNYMESATREAVAMESGAIPLSSPQQIPPPQPPLLHLEAVPNLLWQAVSLAHSLVAQLKN